MTKATDTRLTREAFRHALEVHGADRLRWPIEVRAGAAVLLAGDAAAVQLYAEAEALEAVLDRAPRVAAARERALIERIVAAAERTPRVVSSNRAATPMSMVAARAEPVGLARRLLARRGFGGGALLAASLVLGLLVGGTGVTHQSLTALGELAGLALGGNHASAALAQLDEALDEENL